MPVAQQTIDLPRVNTTTGARLLGVTTGYMSQLVKQKIIRRGKDGLFDPYDLVHDHQSHREDVLKHKWSADGESRSRLSSAKAEITELKLKQLRNELVPLSAVGPAIAVMIERCRTRLLAIPVRLAGRLVTAQNAIEAQAMIKAEIDAALVELAQPDVGSS